MNPCEDREEGDPPSKISLCGEHDSQKKAQSPEKQHTPDSPGPTPESEPESSCVSFKSDRSNDRDIDFKGRQHSAAKSKHGRQDSAEPGPRPEHKHSRVSFKSDRSNVCDTDLKGQPPTAARR
ncbi:uncharacterized protein ABDE67_005254 [Symphorus nematophorus]